MVGVRFLPSISREIRLRDRLGRCRVTNLPIVSNRSRFVRAGGHVARIHLRCPTLSRLEFDGTIFRVAHTARTFIRRRRVAFQRRRHRMPTRIVN